jgi:hypothetical protein
MSFFRSGSSPYGITYGSWTVRWWKWFLFTPKSINPVLDDTGVYASINQPDKDVWFLAGKLVDDNRGLPSRSCTVPPRRSILFPVINFEANPLEYSELKTEHDILDRVQMEEDTITKRHCSLDGRLIPPQRVKSDPIMFEIRISKDNAANIEQGGDTFASADGYWVFLKPLPIGNHVISFEGSCQSGKLKSGANYHIKVSD